MWKCWKSTEAISGNTIQCCHGICLHFWLHTFEGRSNKIKTFLLLFCIDNGGCHFDGIMVHRDQQKGTQIFLDFFKIFNHFLQFLLKIESGFRPGRLCDMGKRKMVPMDRYHRNTWMFHFGHGIHDYLLPILPSGR